MNKDSLKKIPMKEDGKDLERFQAALGKIVSVPKKDVEERDKKGPETAKPQRSQG